MKIAIGNDHVGYELKLYIKEFLEKQGHEVTDAGAHDGGRSDYPVYAMKVSQLVLTGGCERGILICGTGNGISLAANKVRGIRCVLCSEPYTARLARLHNDANILAFGARVIGPAMAEMLVNEFLCNDFEGGRHGERLNIIKRIEAGEHL